MQILWHMMYKKGDDQRTDVYKILNIFTPHITIHLKLTWSPTFSLLTSYSLLLSIKSY